ncbi:MAG: molybdopterin-guanine dinucleotide biosynthesis protein [Pseudonocardiales bacterium]|nr:MAG: molybdopterin-guanine dinucleotide biosynthesis protein [Pseudonocardiales bacterium]
MVGVNSLKEWVDLVCRELDITDAVSPTAMQSRVLDMSRDVAHGVARPAAPLTAYLLGLAAGRSSDPEAAADELTQRVCQLAQRWADEHPSSAGAGSSPPG